MLMCAACAVQRYTEALLLAPHLPVLRVNRALSLTRKGEWERAAEDCRIALSADPQYLKASGLACTVDDYTKILRQAL